MNTSEALLALAKCQAFDNRSVTETNGRAWAEALTDITLTDALEAISVHFKGSREWLMPSTVREIVTAKRKALIAAAGPVDYPEGLTAIQEQDWRRAYHRRIGDGTPPAEALLLADRDYEVDRAKQIAPMPDGLKLAIGLAMK